MSAPSAGRETTSVPSRSLLSWGGTVGRKARRSPLALEITVALCVKLLLLFTLHQIWFSHPESKRLTERGVSAALFGPASIPSPNMERPDGSGP